MKSIVVVGENSTAADRRYMEFLKNCFESSRRRLVFAGNSFSDRESGEEELVLCECGKIERINSKNCILLLKESFCPKNIIGSLHGCTAIVSSENEYGVKFLAEQGIQTVTCGLSGKDTVTISSFTGERVMVSLQRELRSCSGKMLQPVEISVELGSIRDRYTIMSGIAAKLLAE